MSAFDPYRTFAANVGALPQIKHAATSQELKEGGH
jgi:hypothetical protein